MLAATLANVNRDPKQRSEPYEPADFFPLLRIPKPEPLPQSPDEMEAKLKEITLKFGGKVEDGHQVNP
ncbi:MAG TPA: hypothetical protein VG206_02875 [Terriglobia bacterium]|nr:hypothetical protein [Terriglobia bacterium]